MIQDEHLPKWLPSCRWFGMKARTIQRTSIQDWITLATESGWARVLISFTDGTEAVVQVPLAHVSPAHAADLPSSAIIAEIEGSFWVDGLFSETCRSVLVALIKGGSITGAHGTLTGTPGRALEQVLPKDADSWRTKGLGLEQSNSALTVNDQAFVKLFRNLECGINLDAKITRFLTEEAEFTHCPSFLGTLEYRWDGGTETVALATEWVQSKGVAWDLAVQTAQACFQNLNAETDGTFEFIDAEFLRRMSQLGKRTAQMHLAFATAREDAWFTPAPLEARDLAGLEASILRLLNEASMGLSEAAHSENSENLALCAPKIRNAANLLTSESLECIKTRVHGDYHLGQVLDLGFDFAILDFEGEPLRSLAERQVLQSPLKDVAGMLRSFDYAAHVALSNMPRASSLKKWVPLWTRSVARAFLLGWNREAAGTLLRPRDDKDFAKLLNGFVIEKALYELKYELNNRPAWVRIPLLGIMGTVSESAA